MATRGHKGTTYVRAFRSWNFPQTKGHKRKFDQVEQHLLYFHLVQKRRKNGEDVKVTNIVALASVFTTLSWSVIKVELSELGKLDLRRHLLCNELAKEGRLLVLHIDALWTSLIPLTSEQIDDATMILLLRFN
jgi:hypothetical protein